MMEAYTHTVAIVVAYLGASITLYLAFLMSIAAIDRLLTLLGVCLTFKQWMLKTEEGRTFVQNLWTSRLHRRWFQ